MKISIPVEIIAGTDLREVASDMIKLAMRTGCMVTADFNGALLIATENTTVSDVVSCYDDHNAETQNS